MAKTVNKPSIAQKATDEDLKKTLNPSVPEPEEEKQQFNANPEIDDEEIDDEEDDEETSAPAAKSDVVVSAQPSVIVPDAAPAPVREKMVKIRPALDHKCNIGGEWYDLKKEVVCEVPENVKRILSKNNLLLPV